MKKKVLFLIGVFIILTLLIHACGRGKTLSKERIDTMPTIESFPITPSPPPIAPTTSMVEDVEAGIKKAVEESLVTEISIVEASQTLAATEDKDEVLYAPFYELDLTVTIIDPINKRAWTDVGWSFSEEEKAFEDLAPQKLNEPCTFYKFKGVGTGQWISSCFQSITQAPYKAAAIVTIIDNESGEVIQLVP